MAFVLDSSVVLAWMLPDESGAAVHALADRLEKETAVAPAIWPLEVRNALLTAHRRKRLTDKDLDRLLAIVRALPIEIETSMADDALSSIVQLAREHALTIYDAAYLELARRRGLSLATLDAKLIGACQELGVQTLP